MSWSIDIQTFEDAIKVLLEEALPDVSIHTADSWLSLRNGEGSPNPPSVYLVHEGGEPEELANVDTSVAGMLRLRWRILLVTESYRGEEYRRTDVYEGAYTLLRAVIGAVIGNNLGLAGVMEGDLDSYGELSEVTGTMVAYEIACSWRSIWSDEP